VAYDPAYAFEIAHIVENGLHRMYGEKQENIFYYLTLYNEPIQQPAEPEGVDVEGLLRGIYRYRAAPETTGPKAQLLASGTGMGWALKAQELLAQDWGVSADVWSVTSWTELRRDAVETEEHNLLNPGDQPRKPYIQVKLEGTEGPAVAVSDFMRAVPDLISRWVPNDYTSLGTDGFGMSDTRHALRRHFHVDAESIVVRTLASLADWGQLDRSVVKQAVEKYQVNDVQAAPPEERSDPSPAT